MEKEKSWVNIRKGRQKDGVTQIAAPGGKRVMPVGPALCSC